jgi:hypothetical protein
MTTSELLSLISTKLASTGLRSIKALNLREVLNEIVNSIATLGYTKTVIEISAEEAADWHVLATDLIAAPGEGKYYEWFAKFEKHDDGYFNIPVMDQIFIGTEDYFDGALIGNLGAANNSMFPLLVNCQPAPIINANDNLCYQFTAPNQKLIVGLYNGFEPNAVTCSFTITLYTKIVDFSA